MRVLATVTVAALLVVAGCVSPIASGDGGSTATPEPTTVEPTTTDDEPGVAPPDPETDRIGWEDGVWYNESIDVDNTDGLTDEEFRKVLGRTAARVEYIRGKEFTDDVAVRRFDPDQSPGVIRPQENESLLTFEDVRYEALFQVGDQANGREVFWNGLENRGAFYDYWNHSAVLLVTDRERPIIDPQRFSHELAHALQDQQYNLTEFVGRPTMDGSYARRGVVEGGAKIVDREYATRCRSGEWECLDVPENDRVDAGVPHYGLWGMQLVWYEHGMRFLWDDYRQNGTDALDRHFQNPPASTEQLFDESAYPDDHPVNVSLEDTASNGWERVRPDRGFPYQQRPAHARSGQVGIASMFIQTGTPNLQRTKYNAYNSSSVINVSRVGNSGWATDPETAHADYDFAYADGWAGDRLHVYQRGNQTGYVWRIVWDSPEAAAEFHDGYRQLLLHWGGEEVDDGVWRIEDNSPFTDAIRVAVENETVTIVNAPTVDDLGDVSDAGG